MRVYGYKKNLFYGILFNCGNRVPTDSWSISRFPCKFLFAYALFMVGDVFILNDLCLRKCLCKKRLFVKQEDLFILKKDECITISHAYIILTNATSYSLHNEISTDLSK